MELRAWESLDSICAVRLILSLLRMVRHVSSFGVLVLSSEVESQLATISCATVQLMLRKNRARKAHLPRIGPNRANQVHTISLFSCLAPLGAVSGTGRRL